MDRKHFIKSAAVSTALLGVASFPFEAFAAAGLTKITILHTNDQHSRIDPFPMDGTKLQGLGGFAKRAKVIGDIRTIEKNVLLLDSGDIFQGTPYFNIYKGETEIKLMSEMGYQASTLGNHDFDGGIDNLATRAREASFPFLVSNYDLTDTPLAAIMQEHKIFIYDGVRIGVFGIGIELSGLVPDDLYKGTRYLDPITHATRVAHSLRHEHHCDWVICLSHLGDKYDTTKVSDEVLAQSTTDIDLILGAHTHRLFEKPLSYHNLDGKPTLVNQVGWAGICLGQIDIFFNKTSKKSMVKHDKHAIM
jgi:5'-nucleotidase